MRSILILTFILSSFTVYAQYGFTLRDSETGKSVDGAVVNVSSIRGEKGETSISSKDGQVSVSIPPPFIYEIRHIAYSFTKDTLTAGKEIINLKPANVNLDEVVVTGQYAPQSAKNSVYNVRSISSERIQTQGATQLQDILANELNINFARDNALGSSNLSLQGLSGQNIKILIDGVPMVGRGGVANEIDINQINVNSIERIEIVEGPMAVNFGADALAGVINIITRKDSNGRFDLTIGLHEESVASEYSFFQRGIHSPSLQLNFTPSENWYFQAEGRVNHFGGWIGNGTDRNRQWYPKSQYFGGGLVRFEKDEFNIYYRFDHLNELIQNQGQINDSNPLRDPFAVDEEYQTFRNMHQVQSEFAVHSWDFNPVFSFTDYHRKTRQFTKNLITQEERNTIEDEQENVSFKTLFFRNTASRSNTWGDLQLGIESTYENASGSTLNEGMKNATDIAFFISSEIGLGENVMVRPGIRYGYNSIYETIPTPSVNIKYSVLPGTLIRLGYGRGFRAPSLRELYHEFIDANHNIIGNPELSPEYSHNINFDIEQQINQLNATTTLTGFYNQIENRISFFTPEESNAATTYLNLDEFRTTGLRWVNSLKTQRVDVSAGTAYTGRYQRLRESNLVPDFLFGLEANSNVSYRMLQYGITLSAFYKYTGPFKDYRLVNDEPELQQIEDFHLLDLSITKKINDQGTLTFGSRNLLNIDFVNNTMTGGAHSNGGGQTSVGYGRSYFVKFNYQLSVK